ncbi:DNA polymerase III subunit alpha [Candidatus Kaiserbacteria bacterium CG10_big_fil_rev_8_21_14_0_10_51_14]|uniref:DNA polymerase III subunit alpha n=1 Tax=Candidatus Kaiserbacteria bacterium CG10_big_fil_rev_8_21_14_0_10_51_14 TaxID=1974610 RepID=A0A2H0UBF8_9BACT|nr:MAG: DNA polymerase III subunit alpha [Candidatus Kaiserbacteria bacterium CG10_big_fil_rev_8_21_14_0_10_51_14]
MKSNFVHLHTHSHYSLLEAIPKIPELVAAAKIDGQEALALTDNGNLYGAIDFYKECKESGIKPIIGVDFFVAPRTRHDKEHRVDDHTYRLVLLAKNEAGYRNLLQMVSRSHLEGFHLRPRIDRELMEAHREGLIAILPSFGGEHTQLIKDKNIEKAKEIIDSYRRIYDDNLSIEISRHPEIDEHEKTMKTLVEIAKEMKIPIVAAHDSYYLTQEDALARELVDKIRTANVLNRDFEQGAHDFSFISRARAGELFADVQEAIENSAKIAEMCNLELKLGRWVFPEFPIPHGSSADKELRTLADQGFAERGVEKTKENLERVEYELSIIGSKGYSPYFLVVADLLRHAREEKILTNTRGSAAGSLVSYLSGITTVNPIEYQLPFERFLNPERPSPPDIDMDLADDKRDKLITYVREKYGEEKVAQIGTFGTMMARAAVRDVARALGHSYGLGDRIAKLIPFGKQGFPVTIAGALKETPELMDIYKNDADARELLDLAQKIEGNARHVGVHAAGVVIAPTSVSDFSPIQLDPKGNHIITQYDMYAVEEAGLLKFDFLGLTNLSVLADSVARVEKRLGVSINLDRLPLDDTKTYGMLSRGETLGVFQLAGGGMTSYLVDLKPTSIHDINAMVALYRPGPMAFIPAYIERKKNPKLVKYLDPRMEPILKNSYGVITYQDDVLELAIKIAGYSWLEADKFRKAMGKKIPREMAAQKEKFTAGCVKHGMKKEAVQKLWEQIETFAAYGFNKAHAASYGNLAYKTAYMKAHFPVDYMAAVLTADAGDVDRIAEIVAECKRMGIKILPPSVQSSYGNFTVTNDAEIRFGLYSIKNFGTGVADSIIAARDPSNSSGQGKKGPSTSFDTAQDTSLRTGGPFADIADFLSRVSDPSTKLGTGNNLNKKSLESLIQSGALDELGERGNMLAHIETLLEYHREHTKVSADQNSLFGAHSARAPLKLASTSAATLEERLTWEKELLGLYVSGHPLDKHKEKFSDPKKSIKHAKEHLLNAETVIAGFVESARINTTKNGERMAFLKLSDFSGSIELVAFPRTYKEFGTILIPSACIAVKGRISDRNGEASFVIEKAKAL